MLQVGCRVGVSRGAGNRVIAKAPKRTSLAREADSCCIYPLRVPPNHAGETEPILGTGKACSTLEIWTPTMEFFYLQPPPPPPPPPSTSAASATVKHFSLIMIRCTLKLRLTNRLEAQIFL